MSEREIRFAVMGAGKIAPKFCSAAKSVQGVSVVAVASKSLQRAEDFARHNEIESFYGDYGEMLEREDIDAVYISTTHNFHRDNIRQCLEGGKHVLCEKSMLTNSRDARELFALARERGLLLTEAMWIRHLPSMNKVREWLSEGKIGDIKLSSLIAGFNARVSESDRLINPALGGGVAFDISVYAIETATYLFGTDIIKTTASAHRGKTGVDVVNNICFDYESFPVSILTTLCASPPNELLIAGDKGHITVPTFIGAKECFLHVDGCETERFFAPYENGFQFEIEDFAQCIRSGKSESDVMPSRDTIQCCETYDKLFI